MALCFLWPSYRDVRIAIPTTSLGSNVKKGMRAKLQNGFAHIEGAECGEKGANIAERP